MSEQATPHRPRPFRCGYDHQGNAWVECPDCHREVYGFRDQFPDMCGHCDAHFTKGTWRREWNGRRYEYFVTPERP